ncbi:MAG TPA: cupin domain-containing protein [Stellaceae bacterium]|jgi:uncharacterized protein YjlB
MEIETLELADDGVVPNNTLPLVVYRGVLSDGNDRARECIALFNRNGWPNPWRNGIYGHHHYHSTAHEVLGIAAGSARVRLGGEKGESIELRAGDVVVIPAGVAHKCEAASGDLLVIGSYPDGQSPDICRAKAAEHDRAAANVARVALPANDPVKGGVGPLFDYWGR